MIRTDRGSTVELLKCDIQRQTQIPLSRQRLIHEDSLLSNTSCLAEVAPAAKVWELKLIKMQKPIPDQVTSDYIDPSLLNRAIRGGDLEKCTWLLSLRNLPGLNEKDHTCSTVLHHAAW